MVFVIKIDIEKETFEITNVNMFSAELLEEISCRYFEIVCFDKYTCFCDDNPSHLDKKAVIMGLVFKGIVLITKEDTATAEENYINMDERDLQFIKTRTYF